MKLYMNEWMAQEYAEAGGTLPVEVVKSDAMVLWQEPGDNYVRVGTLLGRSDKMFMFDVKRWGTVEIVTNELIREIA